MTQQRPNKNPMLTALTHRDFQSSHTQTRSLSNTCVACLYFHSHYTYLDLVWFACSVLPAFACPAHFTVILDRTLASSCVILSTCAPGCTFSFFHNRRKGPGVRAMRWL
ncbi:hypothetical protein EDB89DRAFT_1918701 [Lactarius sanguifluus]|nr:hypothetical protein EDB89DRAFT_1918701 [Lactarius sanguifluus]